MEGEKKRKRVDHHHGEVERRKKERGLEDEVSAPVPASAAQPSEEEVEEFFSILRRMHVAVKYFEKSGSEVNGDVCKLTALEEGAVNGVKIVKKKRDGGLDLNAAPEAES